MDKRVYDSYSEAAAECGEGYQDVDLANVIFQKTKSFPRATICEHSHAWLGPALLALAMASRFRSKVHVLDFGGQFGLHQEAAQQVLSDVKTKWAVVEIPGIVGRARELESKSRRWFPELRGAESWLGHVDLVICSGALQYQIEPAETIDQLVGLGAQLILWQRMATTTYDRPFSAIQISRLADNGPGALPKGVKDREVHFPITYFPENDFIDAHIGYRQLFRMGDAHNGDVDGRPISLDAAYLFEKLQKSEHVIGKRFRLKVARFLAHLASRLS